MNANLTVTLDKNSIDILVREISDKISISNERTDLLPKSAPPSLLSINDMCKLFKVSRVTISNWMKQGRLPFKKVSRRVYFVQEDVLNSIPEFHLKSVHHFQKSLKQEVRNGNAK